MTTDPLAANGGHHYRGYGEIVARSSRCRNDLRIRSPSGMPWRRAWRCALALRYARASFVENSLEQ